MSEKFNEYSQKIKSGLSEAVDFISEQTGKVVDKTKVRMALSKEKTELDIIYKKIGQHYFNLFSDGGPVDEDIIEDCRNAEKRIEMIKLLEAEL